MAGLLHSVWRQTAWAMNAWPAHKVATGAGGGGSGVGATGAGASTAGAAGAGAMGGRAVAVFDAVRAGARAAGSDLGAGVRARDGAAAEADDSQQKTLSQFLWTGWAPLETYGSTRKSDRWF